MPSKKILSAKQEIANALNERIKNASAGVLVSYKGINVEDDTKLRSELRAAGVDYAVVKNTVLRFALNGTDYTDMDSVLEGTTAIAISKDDPMAAARILQKFADTSDTFKVKSGFMDGKVMSADEVSAIAKLPNREGMLSMFAGALTSTLSGMAVAMQAYADKQGEPAA